MASESLPTSAAPARTQAAFCEMAAVEESGTESATDHAPVVCRAIIETVSATRPARCIIDRRRSPTSRRRGRRASGDTIGESVTR
jgi:hypothetical protein